jgi:hypothetical protein
LRGILRYFDFKAVVDDLSLTNLKLVVNISKISKLKNARHYDYSLWQAMEKFK